VFTLKQIFASSWRLALVSQPRVINARDRQHPQLGGISHEIVATRRRQPIAAARALLIVIAADPDFVMRSLAKSA
jgi:hypothetical protein